MTKLKKDFVSDEYGTSYNEYEVDKDGLLHGKYTRYYIDDDNKPIGILRTFNCIDGLAQGYYKEFHLNGKIKQEGSYKNSRIHGTTRIYNEDGILHVECNYTDGLLEGRFIIWRDSAKGLMQERSECVNDKPIYTYTYDEEGRMTSELYFDENVMCTEEVLYERVDGHCYVSRAWSGNPYYLKSMYA